MVEPGAEGGAADYRCAKSDSVLDVATVVSGDGTRISYGQFGRSEGDPLLLLMGLGIDRWGWVRQRGAFGARYRCITPDNRGTGLSDKPEDGYSIDVMAEDAVAVLDHAGIGSAHVLGASMGGAIAQVLAVRHPDRVRSLTLACTAGRLHTWRRQLLHEWLELLEARGRTAFARENLRWVVGARHLRRLWPAAGLIAPLATRAPARGIRGHIQALLDIRPDTYEALGMPIPDTMVMTGSQDILTPVADAEDLVEQIPGARLEIVLGAAHGFMVTRAAEFNRRTLSFLESATKAQRGLV